MENFLSICLSWCGTRPPVLRMKKTFDYASSVSHRSLMSQMFHLSSTKSKSPATDPKKARKDRGCSSDFCAEALREWTEWSMTEKIRKQRSEIARETTRPPKKSFFTIYHLDFFIRRCVVSSQEAGYIPSEQRIHWSLKTLSYVVKRLERLCFPASVFILKFFAFHPLIFLDFSIRKDML